MKSKIIFDIEGNNLLYGISKIWCICTYNITTRESLQFYEDTLVDGLKLLQDSDLIIGHNITGFDLPAIKKLYPWWTYKDIRDTYVMSKLFNPDRAQGHSLESYGEQFSRAKPKHEDWTQFSPEMLYRCSEDVEINKLTYEFLVQRYCQDWSWIEALKLEQQFAIYQAYQELAGVDFDVQKAKDLLVLIDSEVDKLDKELYNRIPKRVKQVGATVTKPFKKNGEYTVQVERWIHGD